jgi:hypothetical protein
MDESQEWAVFNQSGDQVAAVTIPGSMEVWDAGADYVLVQVTDELGLEEVRVYGLEFPR